MLRKAVILPLLLAFLVALLLSLQIGRLIAVASQVENSNRLITNAWAIQTHALDVETGMRGYLLTEDSNFLRPYFLGKSALLPSLLRLRTLVDDNPLQLNRVGALGVLLSRWLLVSDSLIRAKADAKPYLERVRRSESRIIVENIREQIRMLIQTEEVLRDSRNEAVGTEVRRVLTGTLGLALFSGVLLAVFSRRQLLILSKRYDDALQLERSRSLALSESRKELEKAHDELERRVQQRTIALSAANRELESFSYAVSHDLRAPLRSIDGFSQALDEDLSEHLDQRGKDYLNRIRQAAQRMGTLIDDLLNLSRLTRTQMNWQTVDLSAIASRIIDELRLMDPERSVQVRIMPSIQVRGDPGLLTVVLQNLFSNAWKFTAKKSDARIEFDAIDSDEGRIYRVHDNGAGFDMAYSDKLFGAFQRLHKVSEYPGTGVGLATVRRVVHRHGGRIWADSKPGQGAVFSFTLSRVSKPGDAGVKEAA